MFQPLKNKLMLFCEIFGMSCFSQTTNVDFSWLEPNIVETATSPFYETNLCENFQFTISSSQGFTSHEVANPYNSNGIIIPANINLQETFIDISITFNQQVDNLKIRFIDLDENANAYSDPEEFISEIIPPPSSITNVNLPVNSFYFNSGILTPNDNNLNVNNNDASGWVCWTGQMSSVNFRYNRPGPLYGLIIDSIRFDCESIESADLSSLIEMPNVFTPTNNGNNDFFKPIISKNIKFPSLVILNRWGNVVFETNDINIGWNGKTNDQECTEGIYFWKLVYQDLNSNFFSKHGFLHLIR